MAQSDSKTDQKLAEYYPDSMRGAVVGERDLRRALHDRLAVELDAANSATYAARVFDRDLVARRAESIGNLEAGPPGRYAWIDHQRLTAQSKSQYPLEPRAIHPYRRARVPGPSSAPDVRGHRVDVGACDVRLDLVAMDSGARVSVIDRVQHREQIACPVAVTEHRKRDNRPDGAVRVLAAVLPDAGRIALDIAGVERSAI